MTEAGPGTVRAGLGQALAFARWTEPVAVPSRRNLVADAALAGSVLLASLMAGGSRSPQLAAAAVATSVPLAARRWRPLSAFLLVLLAALAAREHATNVTFVAVVIAAYSAAMHSRRRGAALLSLAPAGLVLLAVYWNAPGPGDLERAVRAVPFSRRQDGVPVAPPGPGRLVDLVAAPGTPWRLPALLVLVSLVSITLVGTAVQLENRIRRLRAEHAVAVEGALEQERARIAAELHDVVTHNVSVMIVQAGAARQVLAATPEDARTALLAVESAGREAMAELRHLLGLLSPLPESAGEADEQLRPQPGLGQLPALIDRVVAAGLPVELRVGALPAELPPGVDLTAYRVLQEALTNVLKHAGRPPTTVRIEHRGHDLVVEVTDSGRTDPATRPAPAGTGRGLLGLRERTALYGGELDAGPRPGGGWRVRARIAMEAPATLGTRPQ